ncbi:MAG: hypothetical protein ACFFDH_17960 [Promethearchaeota archaeon]
MENETKVSWTNFILILIALWILFCIISFFILNTSDLDKLSARLLYYGMFMVLLTYYSAKNYKETTSHLSYLIVDILLIALAFTIFLALKYYTSIVGIF